MKIPVEVTARKLPFNLANPNSRSGGQDETKDKVHAGSGGPTMSRRIIAIAAVLFFSTSHAASLSVSSGLQMWFDATVGIGRFSDQPLDLLVLSACETAVGDDRAALGLAGIALKAGARSAVATLWAINDDATSRLVMNFYERLGDADGAGEEGCGVIAAGI